MANVYRVEKFAIVLVGAMCGAFASLASAQGTDYCVQTADKLLTACKAGVEDVEDVGKAICTNITNTQKRNACLADVEDSENEADALCADQHDTRLAACGVLGQGHYDPDISPARFDDPMHASKPNIYFPLGVGKHWEYRTPTKKDTVDMVNETKLIAGVNCTVIRDLVSEGGFVIEATDDWYASAKDGSVLYFGEDTKDFEEFKGDKPLKPQLVSIEVENEGEVSQLVHCNFDQRCTNLPPP